ncbi:MAG: Calx-beta domain-containing protein [Vicinamibacteria bacterium]
MRTLTAVLGLGVAMGAAMDARAQSIYAYPCSVVEGNAGSGPCAIAFRLIPASTLPVTVDYVSGPGTAASGSDFLPLAGTVTFAPGETERTVAATVLGDAGVEIDETFYVYLNNPVNATTLLAYATATIVDDDGVVGAPLELAHGSRVDGDLAGGTADLYRIRMDPYSSYRIVLEDRAGDATGAQLELLSADLSSVLETATPVGTGGVLALGVVNRAGVPQSNRIVRVSRPACGGACDAQDTYRLSVRETTLRATRFNNKGGQASIFVLSNPTDFFQFAEMHFWDESGAFLGWAPASLDPYGTVVYDTSTSGLLHDRAGSATVLPRFGYGTLAGKIVSLDPATGLAFDTPLEPRPR